MVDKKTTKKTVFDEATAKFEEAQHKMLVELTQQKYADLYAEQQLLKEQIKVFGELLKDVEKRIEELKTKGV